MANVLVSAIVKQEGRIVRSLLLRRIVLLDGRANGLDGSNMDDKMKSGLARLETARREIVGEKD